MEETNAELLDECHNEECCRSLWTRHHIPDNQVVTFGAVEYPLLTSVYRSPVGILSVTGLLYLNQVSFLSLVSGHVSSHNKETQLNGCG